MNILLLKHLFDITLTWINFNPTYIKDYMHYIECDEITYPFPNSQVECWEWMTKFIPILLCVWLFIHAVIKINPY